MHRKRKTFPSRGKGNVPFRTSSQVTESNFAIVMNTTTHITDTKRLLCVTISYISGTCIAFMETLQSLCN